MWKCCKRMMCAMCCLLLLGCCAGTAMAGSDDYTKVLEEQALQYYEDGDTEEAIDLCLWAMSWEPEAAWSYELVGQMVLEANDTSDAAWTVAEMLTKGFEAGAESGYMYCLRSHAYYNQKMFTQALADIEKAIALEPTGTGYDELRSLILAELGEEPGKAVTPAIPEIPVTPAVQQSGAGYPVTFGNLTVTFPQKPVDIGDVGDTMCITQLYLDDERTFSFISIYVAGTESAAASSFDAKVMLDVMMEGMEIAPSDRLDGGKTQELSAAGINTHYWAEYLAGGDRCRMVFDGATLFMLTAPDDEQGKAFLESIELL